MVPPVRSRAARFAVPPGVSAETPAIEKGSWQGRQALTEGLWVSCRNGLSVAGDLLLYHAYNPSGSHSFATSPYTGEARGGRSAHPASQQACSISPSVKPFGLATSLVRGRQDGGRKQKNSRRDRREPWQGQKDSNPRHAVLETAALPAELYPFVRMLCYYSAFSAACKGVFEKILPEGRSCPARGLPAAQSA